MSRILLTIFLATLSFSGFAQNTAFPTRPLRVAFTAALAAGATTEEAAQLANYAGGIVVMKRGTATVSRQELLNALEQTPPSTRTH